VKYFFLGTDVGADEERARADEAERQLGAIKIEVAEARAAEVAAAAEASELRRRLDAAEQRANAERNRAIETEQRAERASARVQELAGEMARRAALPKPEPPRTRWRRLMRALGHIR